MDEKFYGNYGYFIQKFTKLKFIDTKKPGLINKPGFYLEKKIISCLLAVSAYREWLHLSALPAMPIVSAVD